MRRNRTLTIGVALLVLAVLLAILTINAAAAGREIRLVCKNQPDVSVVHGGARWIVTIAGDCARPGDEQPPASRPTASETEAIPVETAAPTDVPYPEPTGDPSGEPTFEPYPGP